ncbi:hypothetical protein MOSE0_M05710 [Monosporozyma servazzii]
MLKRWLTVNKTSKKKHASKKDDLSELGSPSQNMEPLRAIVSLETAGEVSSADVDEKRPHENTDRDYLLQSSPTQSDKIFDTTMDRHHLIDSEELADVFDDTLSGEVFDNGSILHEHEFITKISNTDTSNLMPYGNGSNKIFGYENFGNTCYCNSVLQCLYNIPEFRTNILKYPVRPETQSEWTRRDQMVGHTPKVFSESSFAKAVSHKMTINADTDNNTVGNNNDNDKLDQEDPKSSSGRKLLSGFLRYSSRSGDQTSAKMIKQESIEENEEDINSNINNNNNNNNNNNQKAKDQPSNDHDNGSQKTPPPISSSGQYVPLLKYKRIIVGRSLPQRSTKSSNNNQILDSSPLDDELASDESLLKFNEKSITLNNEQRKKSALINGPILNIDYSMFSSNKPNLYTALKDLFESIAENESLTGVVSPTKFIHILKRENVLFNTMMHQDAHEFLNFLLNDLGEYADNTPETFQMNHNQNFIKDLFQGTQSGKIKCLTCDSVTTKNEPFLDFAIEMKENESIDIQEMLYEFHQRELLNSSNKFYCNICCGLQEAERIVGIKSLPKVLALHLKRFKYSEAQNTNVKLFNKIDYPLILDVHSTFDHSVKKKYELAGVVMHMGGGPQHGHYVSLCKTEKFGWLFFDDETVETVEEATVLRFTGDSNSLTTAYVLFYKEICPEIQDFKLFHEDPAAKEEYQHNVDDLLKYDSIHRSKKIQLELEKEEKEHLDGSDPVHNTSTMTLGSGNDTFVSNKSRKSRLFSFMKS